MKRTDPQLDYTQVISHTVTLRGYTIPYFTKPGLPNWNQVTPTTILLADYCSLNPQGRCLLLGCGHGALATALALQLPHGKLEYTDLNWIALQITDQTLRANQIENAQAVAEINILPKQTGYYSVVVMDLPKGRKLARRWLVIAYQALAIDGTLYLSGANDQGIHSVIEDARTLFGNREVLGYKKGCRIARFIKQGSIIESPEWAHEPGIEPGTWHEISVKISQDDYTLHTLPGIFSFDHLDDGTQLLLQTWEAHPGSRVLDLGCGYGLLGIRAAKTGASWVDLVDVNCLAVASTCRNLERCHITNARALPSDILSAVLDQHYDQIITNPPFHSGQTVDYAMTQAFIQQSWHALETNGQFWLVANRFIPYEKILVQSFRSVSRPAETNRYQVLLAIK